MLIRCKTRAFPGPPAVPSEEIWLGTDFLRADPEQDAAGGYVRITPSDSARPSFAVVPLTGPQDPMSVIVWWLVVAANVGVTDGTL